MATKKTNTKTTAKNSVRPEKQPEEPKAVDSMSVDELANMFIQNDTQTMERLKEENRKEPVIEEPEQPEAEKENYLEKILEEVVAETPKEEPKPESEKPKPVVEKKQEQAKPIQPQPNTNRAVYGYDHFGIIYGY
jgi:hypothetical protein